MVRFKYKSVDANGKKQSGIIDAESQIEVKERLRAQNVMVTSLKEGGRTSRKEGLRGTALATFTTQLAQLLTSDIPLYDSLLSLEEQYRGEKFHSTISTICGQIKEGISLSDTLGHFPQSFDRLYCAMVAAGESSGTLGETLEKLAILLGKQGKLRKQLITALIYPLLLASFSLVIIFLLITFVIPSLETIFEEREVNHFTQAVISTSHFLNRYWALYLPLLFANLFGWTLFLRAKRGKLLLHHLFLRTPLVKSLVTQAAIARFCRTMETLLHGGVTIIDALRISRKVMKNPLLEEVVERAELRIVEGSSLSTELRQSKLIPPLVPRMLAIGEEGGNSAKMLHKIADLYEEEVEKSLNRVMALAQPVILLIMGLVVGVIMLAVLLPLTDINAFISG